MALDESTFDHLAEAELRSLEDSLSDLDGLEVDLESGILTLEFEDGVKFVVNSHRAARQIWMAAGANAWHFDVDPGTKRWTAAKTGDELRACLGRRVGDKLGRAVELAQPA